MRSPFRHHSIYHYLCRFQVESKNCINRISLQFIPVSEWAASASGGAIDSRNISPEMTRHYQAHADREAKEKYPAELPTLIGGTSENVVLELFRREVIRQLKRLSREQLNAVAEFIRSLKRVRRTDAPARRRAESRSPSL